MIALRRSTERRHDRRSKSEAWHTFSRDDGAGGFASGFGALEELNEYRLSPGASVPHDLRRDAEVLTYVREGVLAHENSIRAGEFQRITLRRGAERSEARGSRTDWAHVFQIWLRPSAAEIDPSHEQKRFSAAERRGGLCVVASQDSRMGSLLVHQDAIVYSALLDRGQHVIQELAKGRSAWLHLVRGEVSLGEDVLKTGDGAGLVAERAVSLTAREETELLLVELGGSSPRQTTAEGPQ